MVLTTTIGNAPAVKEIFHIYTDNLGSILKVIDANGNAVFEAKYDAWGRQYVLSNTIGLYRGYTGHEMLPEFNLINMDGRLYDPIIGRFLSVDNIIQQPDNPHSYNPYSYCFNNPLKYTDPYGEFAWFKNLLLGAVGFVSGYIGNGIATGHWGWSSVKVGLQMAASSLLSFNLGNGEAQFGKFLIGAGLNGVSSIFMPSMNFRLSPHFCLGMNPLIGYGTGGVSLGLSVNVEANFGRWSFGAGVGYGSNYAGCMAAARYAGYGAGYALTFYNAGKFHGNQIEAQKSGTVALHLSRWNFSLSNDLFGDGKDRWRTTSAELSYRNFSIGTYVDTNWGSTESAKYAEEQGTDETMIKDNKRVWIKGDAFYAPFWIGIRQRNQVYRLGYSHRLVQELTQNLVHDKLSHDPLYRNYDNFTQSPYFSIGNPNPYNLWL